MKIFQVINVRWFNATAWYALTLSQLLAEAGHEVIVLTQAGTDSEKKAQEMGLHTIAIDLNTVHPMRFMAAINHIRHLLKTHRPDIVNCHRGEGFFLWGILKYLGFSYKLVRTRGDQRPPKNDPINRYLHATVADAVVVTNKKMSQYFRQTMHTPSNGLWLIHGGVDTHQFKFDPEGRNRIRQEYGFETDEIVIGLLGRFDRVKGHQETIETIAQLKRQGFDNIRLFLIGFDTAMSTSDIQNLIHENGIQEITQISGKREDINSCICALDIGIVASLWSEAIARSALEIMATDRPLVSTSVGVMPDLVSSQMLVEPGNITAMAEAIKSLITDAEVKQNVLKTQKKIMSQLTHQEFLKRSLNLYQSLLD